MPRFQYIGLTASGDKAEGNATASDRAELEIILMKRGIYLESSRPKYSQISLAAVRILKSSEITRITRQMNILLKSKLSLVEALELVAEPVKDGKLRSVLDSLVSGVTAGMSLADTLTLYPALFNDLYTSMIESGELSGNLDTAFGQIADYREKQEATSKKLVAALVYPALVVAVAIGVVAALILYVVPVFSSMYANFGAELPSLTKWIVSASDALRDSIWYWLAGLLVLAGCAVTAFLSVRAKLLFHRALIKAPLLRTMAVKIVSARFCRTMGALLESGVDLIYALRVASRTTGNSYVSTILEEVEAGLSQGKSFTESLSALNFFPKAVLRLTASGEKTGRLGEMLSHAADYYERETDTELTTLTTLIEPVVIIILGAFVAFILIAMYLPLFELVGTI